MRDVASLKASGPKDPCKGAVGDEAPKGRGWELNLAGITSWPGPPQVWLAPQHSTLLLGNLERVAPWWGALGLGVGSRTPHSCHHGNQVAGRGLQPRILEILR